MNTILVLGGYGAVGREAATALVSHLPDAKVIVAGRDPRKARPVSGTGLMRVDAADPADLARALDGVDAVLMCAELDNARVARACLERGVHYLDVSASHHVLAGIEELDDLARKNAATAVLSVGLVPGVTNLLARHCVERSGARDVRVGVLLGAGEQHGPAAVSWTLDGLGALSGSWPMPFPAPYGRRAVHRFPFSDQYTLPATLGLDSAQTGLCLDSRLTTALLAAARLPAVARLLSRPQVRDVLLTALTKVHVGGDGFAVTVRAGGARASFSGRRQSRATGLTAAMLVARLPTMAPGVGHIEQVVEPVPFLTELAENGFTLDLDT
ncbi:saccharopine dehydrogenase family protein [Nonomuraea sp. NPDC059194]|uniref:saccharopine dehydrogenase family protein n=1 Tax=Nonomuraea sp. NPDC059194 TaxID=3346764 RepID=UPI0036925B9A